MRKQDESVKHDWKQRGQTKCSLGEMPGPPGKSALGPFPKTEALGIRIWLCFCMDLGTLAFLKGDATHGDSHPERRHSASQARATSTQWCHQAHEEPKGLGSKSSSCHVVLGPYQEGDGSSGLCFSFALLHS